MLSSVCHFWEAGVTAIQPHPCAHQHHFLIQLSELCVNLPLTHSVSWHGFLLLVLPSSFSLSLVCLQFSRLSAWWLVSPLCTWQYNVFYCVCLSVCLSWPSCSMSFLSTGPSVIRMLLSVVRNLSLPLLFLLSVKNFIKYPPPNTLTLKTF